MYAHVTDGTVDIAPGTPPEKIMINGRWVDLRPRDPETLALAGWYPINESAKPADTATHTWNANYALNGAAVDQTWVQVAKTPEQLQQETADSNYTALIAKATTALNNNITNLPTIQALTTATFANNTQRDNAIKSLATQQVASMKQINALIRVVTGLLSTQDGS